MTYICLSCNNTEEFYRDNIIIKQGTEREYLDEEGENRDYGNYDEDESNIDSYGGIRCCECNNEVNSYETEEELNKLKLEVTPNPPKDWKRMIN